MSALVLAEHDNRELAAATFHAVTAARALTDAVDLLVAGQDCGAVAEAAAKVTGVRRVLLVEHESYAEPVAEDLALLLQAVAGDHDAILAASSSLGKNVLPRLAALLDVAQLSDIVEVLGPDRFKRYIYAGNALATVRTSDAIKVITVRTTAFDAAPAEGGDAAIERLEPVATAGLARFVGREVSGGERPELTSARVVVSGGRGMGSGENFRIVEALADKLGAAVGASRAAVDAGFVPNDYQVGQTGKIVAPDLYVAVGISGAIQHLAGMKDSKVIVAINKDEEAPIFQVADYGLVADLFTAVPELTQALEKADWRMTKTELEDDRPPIPTIQKIGIIGSGQMGTGITEVAALAGFDVHLMDLEQSALDQAIAGIEQRTERRVKKGTLTEGERQAALARIETGCSQEAFGDCELVIEAATENEAIKRQIFENLVEHLRADAVVATNTSSISITRLAAVTDRPGRFIGMHFMNPVPAMKLVELIRGIATGEATYQATREVVQKLGKTPVTAEDFPAFIVNRILLPMINEAVYTLYEGVGNVESIDTAMKLGANHPMGPLQLADFIGLDTCLAVMQVLYEGLADSKYRPCPLLVKYVEAGWLGRKTSRGFYDYRGETPVPTR